MSMQFSMNINLTGVLWYVFTHLPLSLLISSSSSNTTIINTLLTSHPSCKIFLAVISVSLSFFTFNFPIELKINKFYIAPARFSPLIAILFISSLFLQQTHLWKLVALVTITSPYHVPLIDCVCRKVKILFVLSDKDDDDENVGAESENQDSNSHITNSIHEQESDDQESNSHVTINIHEQEAESESENQESNSHVTINIHEQVAA